MAAMPSVEHAGTARLGDTVRGPGELSWFRREFYACLTARADALFELTDALLRAEGPVTSPGEADPDPPSTVAGTAPSTTH